MQYANERRMSALDLIHMGISEGRAEVLQGLPLVVIVPRDDVLRGHSAVTAECPAPFVPTEVQMKPPCGDALEAAEECADVSMYLVDPAESGVVSGVGCRVHGNLQLGHDLGICPILICVHDGALADPVLERSHADLSREGASAADIEEEIIGVVVSCYDTDLLAADPRFGAWAVLSRFPWPVQHPVEACSLEALSKINLIDLYSVAGLDLERREVREHSLHRTETHEPGGLVTDAQPLCDFVAGEAVHEAGGEIHPDALVELRIEEDAAGFPVASDASTAFALPSLGTCRGLPITDVLRASAVRTLHLGNIDMDLQKFPLKSRLEIGYHPDALIGILLGEEGRDIFDDRFSGHALHNNACARAYNNN